jgi:hypothetical protein
MTLDMKENEDLLTNEIGFYYIIQIVTPKSLSIYSENWYLKFTINLLFNSGCRKKDRFHGVSAKTDNLKNIADRKRRLSYQVH